MAFKHRPCKVKYTKEYKTVDEMYKETLQKFADVDKQILENNKKILYLKNKLKQLEIKSEIQQINFKISQLEKSNYNLSSQNDELEYFDMTKDVLIEYYEPKTRDEDIPDEIIEDVDSEQNIIIDSSYNSVITLNEY